MSRLLVLLSHSLHARNFITSGCLEAVAERGHQMTLLLPRNLMGEVADTVDPHAIAERVLPAELYLGGRMRTRLRASFRVASFVRRCHLTTYRQKIKLNRSPWFRLQVAAYGQLARRWNVEELVRRAEKAFPVREDALTLLREVQPELFFFPTLIHEQAEIELLKAARHLGVPSVAFPASWDTLTSKGFFLIPPDFLLVWGEESVRHAIEYHGFSADHVVATGAPHFDVYSAGAPAEPRETFLSRRGIDATKRIILFAGTTISYWEDEPLQLRALSEAVASGELKDCVIWYRPHPRRAYRDVERLTGLPGVYVDDRVMRQKTSGVAAYSVRREDLLHYRSLMDACVGVITAFSTMIIEAALMGKPSLVVGFGRADGTPGRLIQHAEYEHSREVLKTPGVTLCRSLEELKQGIQKVFGGDFGPLAPALQMRAGQIARNLDGGAQGRIVEALERLAGSPGARRR